jgi:hypothetical protein
VLIKSSFLLACLVFCLAQLPILYFAPRLMSLESANYAFVRDSVATEGIHAKLLCLGDSLVKIGVSPLILQSLLHEPTFNLAVIGSRPMSTYCILKRVLQYGGKPKAVLVDFEPGILCNDPRAAVHESAEFYDISDCVDAAATTRDFNYSGALLSAVLVPSYRLKYGLTDWLAKLFHCGNGPDRFTVKKYTRNWLANRGQSLEPANADPMPTNPALADQVLTNWRKVLAARSPWVCNTLNSAYITKFLKLAHERSIKVYWLIPPLHPVAQRETERFGIDDAYVRFVKNFSSSFDNLSIIDGRHSHYAGNCFIDPGHLHRRGTVTYSTALASLMSSDYSQQWITLPSWEEQSADCQLEDVEQSSKLIIAKRR